MVEDYSARKLSVRTDKFPGLSGLALEYSYILNDQYVAGLWRKDLLRGLGWRSGFEEKKGEGIRPLKGTMKSHSSSYGPSWSWGKMNSSISYDIVRHVKGTLEDKVEHGETPRDPEIVSVDIVPEGEDPNGTLISGVIHLRGQLLPAKTNKDGHLIVRHQPFIVYWDLPRAAREVKLLNLGAVGVALVVIQKRDEEFERIGVCCIEQQGWFERIPFEEIYLV